MNITYADVEKRMSHHPPTSDTAAAAHETARIISKAHAKAMMDLLPAGREKSVVMTHLEDALMWANAAIARSGGPAPHLTITGLYEIREDFDQHYGTGNVAHTRTLPAPAEEQGSSPL